MAKKLTPKQLAFVRAYKLNGGNGTEAAREAGYAGSDETLAQVAYENLRKPEISAEIRKIEKAATKKFGIDQERIIMGLAAIAYFDPKDVLTWDHKKGVVWKPMEEIPEHARIALDIWGSPGGKKSTGSVSLRNTTREKALELLGKQGGMFKDGPGGANPDSRKVVLDRLQKYFSKNRRDGSGSGT